MIELKLAKSIGVAGFGGVLGFTGMFAPETIVFGIMGAFTAIVLIPGQARNVWTAFATGAAGIFVALSFTRIVTTILSAIGTKYLPIVTDLETQLRPCVAFLLGLCGLLLAGRAYRFIDTLSNDPRTWIGKSAEAIFRRKENGESRESESNGNANQKT